MRLLFHHHFIKNVIVTAKVIRRSIDSKRYSTERVRESTKAPKRREVAHKKLKNVLLDYQVSLFLAGGPF